MNAALLAPAQTAKALRKMRMHLAVCVVVVLASGAGMVISTPTRSELTRSCEGGVREPIVFGTPTAMRQLASPIGFH